MSVCVLIQLLSVYSGNRLPRDLVVQLCDEADNPTPEENVRIQLTRDAAALKVNYLLLAVLQIFIISSSIKP